MGSLSVLFTVLTPAPRIVPGIFSSVAQLCLTFCDCHGLQHARPPCPSPTPGVYPNSLSIELGMPSNHLILCCPLFLLPSIPPSFNYRIHVQLFVTPWTAARQASLYYQLKLMSTESVMPSDHVILCHPLLLPSIFPSIRCF